MKRDEAMKLVEDASEQLLAALESGHSEALAAYLATLARFHNYSFKNVMLIAVQKPDATHVAGLLLQRLPSHGGTETAPQETLDETWQRVNHLAATLKDGELLTLDTDTLIHRLFWEEDLIAFEPQDVRWYCPCSRERVGNMLRALGQQEIEDILSERDKIDILCNFCGKPYQFDAVDCASLFTGNPGTTHEADDSIH